jgi:hypothetical protein
MKKAYFISTILLAIATLSASAQQYGSGDPEKFGRTLNLGAGFGYYNGYANQVSPYLTANYEFDIARNFTLAPFVGVYTYTNHYYWGAYDNNGNPNYPYRNYSYRQTVIPAGVKCAYYFDELLHANKRWDFYAAASLGFEYVQTTWDSDYYGDKGVAQAVSPVFATAHAGARLHCTPRFGIFLDLSTGFSTFGLSFKL